MQLVWAKTQILTTSSVEQINSAPGVYRISVEQNNGDLKIVYVGQTNDLRSRLNQYLNGDTDNYCLLNHLKNHICYFRVAGVGRQLDRDACERALFNRIRPECNNPDKIPNVYPADINIE